MAEILPSNPIYVVPERSSYVSYVSTFIDQKMVTNQKVASLASHICSLPQNKIQIDTNQSSFISNKDVLLYDILLKNVSNLNADLQSKILPQTPGFQAWITAKMYCKDEAVRQYSNLVLKELKIPYLIGDPTEILLRHVFKELTLNSNKAEISKLLEESRTQNTILPQAKSRIIMFVEKVSSLASTILSFAAIPLALYGGYRIWSGIWKVIEYVKVNHLPVLVNKIINHVPAPIIRIATKIYDWRFTIFITSIIVKFTRLNNYRVVRVGTKILSEIAYLPITISQKICELPFKTAYYSYNKIREATAGTIHGMRLGSGFIESWRIANELNEAENVWVDQVMNLKMGRA